VTSRSSRRESRRALDGDALLALQFHTIHLGTDIILPSHFPARTSISAPALKKKRVKTHLVDIAYPARIVQNPFRERGLPRVYMR
jgi:hypothetical protein